MVIGIVLSLFLSRRFAKLKVLKMVLTGMLLFGFLTYGFHIILKRSDVSGYIGSDNSAEDRLLAWKCAIRMAEDRPFFGVGWNLFSEYVRSYGHNLKIIAHNTPLSVLAETGIFGFIFYLAILYQSFAQLIKIRKHWLSVQDKENLLILTQGVLISLICYVVNTTFSVKDHDPIYWALLSLTGVLCAIYQKDNLKSVVNNNNLQKANQR